MLEASEREAVASGPDAIRAVEHTVEDTDGESVAGANPIDDPGNHNFFGLRRAVESVDAGRDPMPVGIVDVAGGRGNQLELGEGCEGGLRCLALPRGRRT